ncbi:hypothetical protein IAU60_005474 [Kwoniella sp. DSM 27419]
MRLSVHLFQEKHLADFAHLHEEDYRTEEERMRMLRVEQERLEEARRVGRAKRRSLAYALDPARSDFVKESGTAHTSGWRPLSLLAKRQPGPSGDHRRIASQPKAKVTPLGQRRSNTADRSLGTDPDTPDLASPLPSDVHSPDLALVTPNQAGITLGCDSVPALPYGDKHPQRGKADPADDSVQSSTYSWASSFSGETVELRTAAHYVPRLASPQACASPAEREEVLDSPEKTQRRRKRIVALAHTVRQLEGVGSRDVEDPTFYHTLVKAWNERPGVQPVEPVWAPETVSKAQAPPIPPRPELELNPARVEHYPAPPAWLAPPPLTFANTTINTHEISKFSADTPDSGSLSPSPVPSSDLEHGTPDRSGSASWASSNPFRYSYASTLHDLALEGGLQHGNNLMKEKAWLRSPLFDQGTYFDAHSPSAPFPLGTFQSAPRVPTQPEAGSSSSRGSNASREELCLPDVGTSRPLRRRKTDISQLKRAEGASHERPSSQAYRATVAPSAVPAPTANWGLGFLGDWLKEELAEGPGDDRVVDTAGSSGGADFRYGENGKYGVEAMAGMATAAATTSPRKRKREEEEISSGFSAAAEGDRVQAWVAQDMAQRDIGEYTLDVNLAQGANFESSSASFQTVDLVLPPPLPTPELELELQNGDALSAGAGKTHPLSLPEECVRAAKEYQYSTPCPRQSYSIPSHMSYPHQVEYCTGDPSAAGRVSAGALVHPGTVVMAADYSGSSGNSSSQSPSRTPSDGLALPPHQSLQPPQERAPAGVLNPAAAAYLTSTPHKTQSPSQTRPVPVLPPLPPTPASASKYRRPTPPFPLQPFIDAAQSPRNQAMDTWIQPEIEGPIDAASPRTPTGSLRLNQTVSGSPTIAIRPSALYPTTLRRGYDRCSYPGITGSVSAMPPAERSHLEVDESAGHTEARASPAQADTFVVPPRTGSRSRTPMILFIMGFLCPVLWFVGGWSVRRSSQACSVSDTEAGHIGTMNGDIPTVADKSRARMIGWLDHPDSMVKACRIAAVTITPAVIIGAIVAVVIVVVVL